MGACENTCEAHEPSFHCAADGIEEHSCWGIKDSEQLPCSETYCNPIDSNVDPTGAIDGNDGFASSSNVVQDVLVGQGIGSVGQSENAVGTIEGKLLEDECGVSGGCWNEMQNEVDDCIGETGRLCEEEVGFSGLNEGWVNCGRLLVESVAVSGPLATCGQQDGQTDDKNAGARGVMEEKSDVLVAIGTDICDEVVTSSFCETSAELIPVNDMARNGDRQDDEKDNESGKGQGVKGEKIDGLDASGTVNCDETVFSPTCEMPAKLIQVNDLCKNCNQQDDRKDDKSGVVQGAMEENRDGLASRLADNFNEIVLSSSCDMHAELILTNGFSSDGTELNKHDYETSQQVAGEERNSSLTTVLEISDVHVVMEQKSDGFMEKEFMDACEKTLPSPGHGMTSESLPVNCLSRNGVEQDKQDSSTSMAVAMEEKSNDLSGIENSRIEGVVQEKSNGLAAIETYTCDDISPSLGCEIPAGLIPADGSPINGVEQDKQDNCTSPVVVMEEKIVLLTMLESDNHNQVLPSMGHQVLSEVTTMTCPSRKGVQQDDRMGDQIISCLSSKAINSPFHKGAIEVEEKNHDLLARVETDIDNQIWNVEMHSESVPFSGLLNGCSHQSKLDTKLISSLTETVLDLESKMSASIGTDMCTEISPHGTIDSSSAVDFSGQTDNEGKDHVGIDCVSKPRCHDIVSSSSRRSAGAHKSSRKTQTKRAARKRRNTTKVRNLHGGVETIFKTATKKRSCSSKLARSSVWGSLGNVTQTFKLINGLELDEIKNHGSVNASVGQGIGKRNDIRTAGRSRRSSRKDCASASRIRLKVKVGKEVCRTESNLKIMIPEEIDSTASVDLISDYGTESYEGTSFDILKLANGTEDKAVEEGTQKDLQSFDSKQENGKACCDPSVMDANLASKDIEGAVISNKSSGDAAEDYLGVCSHTEVEALGVAIEKRYTDPGTSPDSEVINSVPEGQAGARCAEDFSDAIVTSSKAFAADEAVGSERRGNKKESLPHAGNYVLEDGSVAATSINKVKAANKRRSRQRKGDCFSSSEILTSSTSATGLSNSSRKSNGVNAGRSKDSARRQKVNGCRERGNNRKSVKKNKGKEKKSVRDHVVYEGEDDPVADDNGKTISGDDTVKEEVANLDMVSSDVMEQNLSPDNAWVRCDDCLKWRRIPVGLVESISQTNCQWICKDSTDKDFADCSIPQEKSNAEINTELGISDADEDPYDVPSNYTELECRRTSVSKEYEFTRISTNQFLHRSRKTQSIDEIMVCHCKLPPDGRLGCGDECLNRMLNIECVQGTCPCGDLCSNQQFQKQNYAKMLWDRCGKKGFGLRLEEDISRGQFLIEYVGEVLDVHAYEARQKEYASKGHKHFYFMTLDGSEVIDACAKGNLGRFINHSCDPNCRTEKWVVNGEICIGLFALRDIKKGEEVTFDYNYVRVVGAAAKKCYCGSPQCQGYIGGDPTNTEVIDHVDSDEEFPEPVMLEDVEAGGRFKNRIPETSFFGISNDQDKMDSPKTAVWKSEDFTEIEDSMNQSTPSTCQSPTALKMNNLPGDFLSSSQPVEISLQADDVTGKTTSAVQQEISMEETKSKSQKLKASPSSMLSKTSSDERKPKSVTAENKRVFVKSRFIIKTSHQSSLFKKGKSTTSPINVNKVQLIPDKPQEPSMKPKKLTESTSNGHFEAVQEKLNELLDSEGGISKRKDAPRGYLKLLLLTAASGASRNGEAIQSNRELSMILDALLKTRSRVVLMDIMSKNGLRMLHNMMKQYRRDFKKIPILRKLLKVLEYLAVREILTLEHINGGPPCPGMESFRVSMLSLTEHDDKQVHQIARKFRDKWIPRHGRKFSYMDRDDGRTEFQRGSKCNRVPASHNHWHDHGVRYTEASNCVMESNLATTSAGTTVNESTSAPCVGSGTRTRKRKSRWDQPADGNTALRLLQHNEQKVESGLLQQSESNSLRETSKEVLDHADKADGEYNYCPHCVRDFCQQGETISVDDGRENTHEDVPPGFSPPVIPAPVSSRASSTATKLLQQDVCRLNCPVDAVDGFPQRKFISRLPVSYGIPLPIVQRFGSSLAETEESWVVAPGMPFHPFPPLPPLPSYKKETSPSCALNSMEIDGIPDRGQQDCHDSATCLKENNPSTTGADQPDMDGPGTNDHQTFKRAKGSSYDLGRRYFRQQKWNRVPPPWVRNRNGWGDNSRGGVCSTEGGNLTNEHRNSYC